MQKWYKSIIWSFGLTYFEMYLVHYFIVSYRKLFYYFTILLFYIILQGITLQFT